MKSSSAGNVAGVMAVLSWGTLGVLGKFAEKADSRLVLILCFAIAAIIGAAMCSKTGRPLRAELNKANLIFAGLISAYHLLYFTSFSFAPALHVSLINYLWPALLILLGNLFFGLKSGWTGYAGAVLGFVGITVLLFGDVSTTYDITSTFGYVLALSGAILWALYSNFRRTNQSDPLTSMTVICFMSSIVCLATMLVGNHNISLPNLSESTTIILLGIGPAGGAFFLWDIGMKRGNTAALAIFGYSAPLLSTLLMVWFGFGEAKWNVALAAILIAAGGVVVSIKGQEEKSH